MHLIRLFQIAVTLITSITSTQPGRSKRIAGAGTLAKPGQFPHAVFLYWYWNVKPLRQLTRFKCSSNLVSKHYLVTAAHCYYHLLYSYRNYSSGEDFVHVMTKKQGHTYTRAGTVDGFGLERGWQDRQAAKVIIPGTYARPSTMFDMDVALVYLPIAYVVDVPHISHVTVARLSEMPGIDDYRDCIVAGFGYVSPKQMQLVIRPDYKYGTPGVMKNKLHYFKVKFALNNFCKYLQRLLDGSTIYFDEFYGCARSIGTSKNSTYATSCFGDSGGPLVCSGLLTGILSQRRELKPCDVTSDTAFTMYTLLGAPDVYRWLRLRMDVAPLVPLPPWDPWAVSEPPIEELRASVGVAVGVGRDGERNGTDPNVVYGSLRQEWVAKSVEIEGGVKNAGERLEKREKSVRVKEERKELDDSKGEVINGSKEGITEHVNMVVNDTVGYGRERIDKNDVITGVKMEGGQLVLDGFKLGTNHTEAGNSNGNLEGSQERATKSDNTDFATGLKGTRPPNTTNTEQQRARQVDDQVLGRGRRDAEVSIGVTAEKKQGQARIRRNANGGVVEGDIRDDDPDLVRLMTLIRGGGVRRKRREAKWRPREAMAKDLLRATRDLDPQALHRFGMGADVLTIDDVEGDEGAKKVWEDVFGEDLA